MKGSRNEKMVVKRFSTGFLMIWFARGNLFKFGLNIENFYNFLIKFTKILISSVRWSS